MPRPTWSAPPPSSHAQAAAARSCRAGDGSRNPSLVEPRTSARAPHRHGRGGGLEGAILVTVGATDRLPTMKGAACGRYMWWGTRGSIVGLEVVDSGKMRSILVLGLARVFYTGRADLQFLENSGTFLQKSVGFARVFYTGGLIHIFWKTRGLFCKKTCGPPRSDDTRRVGRQV